MKDCSWSAVFKTLICDNTLDSKSFNC